MKIGILIYSRPKETEASNTNVARLIEAGVAAGHTVEVLYEALLSFHQHEELEVRYETSTLKQFDVIINRPNFTEEPTLHTLTMELLAKAGFHLVNGHLSVYLTKNKLHQHAVFATADIPCPRWSVVFGPEGVLAATEAIEFPLVAKVAFGTHGKGVFYAENLRTLKPIVDYLCVRDENPVILERFIAEAQHSDVRALVVGGKVIASMERKAMYGDFRANIGSGGSGTKAILTEQETRVVLQATHAFHLEICGVDFIRSHQGPLVLEVNANPGFEELERVTGVDVAAAIIAYAIQSLGLDHSIK